MTQLFKTIFPTAVLAGICIAIGGTVNLRVGGVAGAVLFAFGLTTVVYYGLKLYTGTAGFRYSTWEHRGMLAYSTRRRLCVARRHRACRSNTYRQAGEGLVCLFTTRHWVRFHYDYCRTVCTTRQDAGAAAGSAHLHSLRIYP